MNREFTTRLYEKGDEEGIVELLKICFPEWATREKPLEYWKWKYRDTPLGASIRVSLSDDQVIGVGHDIHLNIKVGPRILRSDYGDDYATHPDFQGMGVYKNLLNRLYGEEGKGIEFLFWLSTNPIVIDSAKRRIDTRVRFKFPYPITHLFRIKDVSMHVNAKKFENKAIVKNGLVGYKVLNKTINTISRKSKVSKDIAINESNEFTEKYDDFWEQFNGRHNFIIEKNAKLLNWRYRDPRGGSYIVREARKRDKLSGFTVLRVKKTKDYLEGYILDIAALSESMEVYHNLLEDACNYFDDLGLNAVHLQLVDGHPLQRYASRHGFMESPEKSKFYIGCELSEGFEKEREVLNNSAPMQLYFSYGEYY